MRIAPALRVVLFLWIGCASLWLAMPATASTTTTLAVTIAGSPVNTISSGTAIALTATVRSGSAPVAPGTVNFCDATAAFCTDIHLLGTAQLTGAGIATTHLVPGVGSHSYKAVFVGTNANAASSSASTILSVTQSGAIFTATNIAQSGVSSGYTLTAAVGQVGSTTPAAPTGSISFLDTSNANTVLGTAALGALTPSLVYTPAISSDIEGTLPLLIGDFNGDGIPDVLTEDLSGNLAVLLGKGDGTFTSKGSNAQVSSTDDFVTSGDFNADDKLDLFVTNYRAKTGTVFLGNGDGTFTAVATQPTIGTSGTSPVVADFNGDGNLDVALINLGPESSTGTLLLGNGDGTFSGVHHPSLGPFDLVTADFNRDGKADLAFLDDYDNLCILLGNANGTFNALPKLAGVGSNISAIADFNGDGFPDVTMLKYQQNGNALETATVNILLGTGDGTFTLVANPFTLTDPFSGVWLGDFNGDGKPDLIVPTRARLYQEPDGAYVYAYSQTALLGQGDGTFTTQNAPTPYINGGNYNIRAADFNGDGVTDVLNINAYGTAGNSVSTILTLNQSATATVSGVTVPPSAGVDLAVANYPGDSTHASSISSATSLAARSLSITPASLTFPATVPGSVAGYQQLTVTNTSPSALGISSIALSDSSPYSWGIREQTCGSSLAAGASCTFDVVFRPTPQPSLPAFLSATVMVKDDAYGSPQQLYTGGLVVATALPAVQVTPLSLAFDPRAVGTDSAYQGVLIENYGLQQVNIESITVTNTKDFYSWGIRGNTCPATLKLYASCYFYVIFRPTHTGPITADIRIKDGGTNSPQLVTLSGTGK